MAAQADRMTRLVADLLSLSRIELNEHIPPSGRVDLDRAAADVVDAVSVLVKQKAISVVLDQGEARPDPATPAAAAWPPSCAQRPLHQS